MNLLFITHKVKLKIHNYFPIVIGLLLVSGSLSIAQDVHYSQFNSAALFQNPGNTGLFDGEHRLAGNFRNQ